MSNQILKAKLNEGKLYLIEQEDKEKIIKVIDNIYFGKNGYIKANQKREGDFKTPLGTYNLGFAFGIDPNINSTYPYYQIINNSYWVDDIESDYYNNWIDINDNKEESIYSYKKNSSNITWSSAEKLDNYPIHYKKAFVIEYNTNECIKGAGSAIFLHLKNEKPYTAGCIAIDEKDMDFIISWIDKEKEPLIIIES